MSIYNCLDLRYKKPFGATKAGELIKIRISLEKEKKVSNPYLLICQIDKWYQFENHPLVYEKEEDNLNWYVAEFSISEAAVYFYFFKLTIDGREFELKRTKNYESILSNTGEFFQLTIYSKESITEKSYNGGIMYQIFPDRFFSSGSAKENVPLDRILRTDWGGLPEYLPNLHGKITNNDYFCGDIKGITSKLDYLKEFAVTTIYINPIFEAHSNHRYDTANYLQIDPLLGTEEDFKELCNEAKKRGIVIILDGVFSHTGSDSMYFNKNNRYNRLGAYNSYKSIFYDWYKFNNYPDDYKCWWGFDTLPEIDKDNESFIQFICGENGVIHKWIKAGAYGFRLDVVDELTQTILERIKEAIIKYGGHILIGEVWEDASTKRSYGQLREYLLGNQLDSTMNYPFRNAILSYVRYGSYEYFYQTLVSIIENYPKGVVDSLMNMLSTHDTERAITKLISEEVNDFDRYWQAKRNTLTNDQYNFGKILFKLASTIQYFLPGLPCIYYGDEAGLYGYKDPFNRGCYPWNKQDDDLVCFFKEIGKVRIKNNILKDGYFKFISIDNELCVFERFNETESIIIAINRLDNFKTLDSIYSGYDKIFQVGEYDNCCLRGYSAVVLKRK